MARLKFKEGAKPGVMHATGFADTAPTKPPFKPEWRDATPYQRGAPQQPHCWELRLTEEARPCISITNAWISNPGKWTMHCYTLGFDAVYLPEANNLEEAKTAAIAKCRGQLLRWSALFGQGLPGAPQETSNFNPDDQR